MDRFDFKILREVLKSRSYILLLSVLLAFSCFFVKSDFLKGSVVEEFNPCESATPSFRLMGEDRLMALTDSALVYEGNVQKEWSMILLQLDDSREIGDGYTVQVIYLDHAGNAKTVEKNISPGEKEALFFSSLIGEADFVQIYVNGHAGQEVNLKNIKFIHYGIQLEGNLLAGLVMLTLGFYLFLNVCMRYARDFFQPRVLFYLLMTVGIVTFLIEGICTNGLATMSFMYVNQNDTYMDFFNSIQYGTMPYERKVIYPPLINCIYALFGSFISKEILETGGTFAVRVSQEGRVLAGVYIILTTIFYSALIREFKQGKRTEKYFFLTLSVFTVPFLWMLERGNIIIVAMCFLMIYVYLYDSEKRAYRHIGMISLAVATSIKIYPAVFGLMLLQKRRYRDVGWCVLYGILIFFLPIVFLGGFENIPLMLRNVMETSQMMPSLGYGYFLNLKSLFGAYGCLLKMTGPLNIVGNIFWVLVLLFGIVLVLWADFNDEWKRVAVLCLMMILLPSFSFTYTMIFMLIPLMMFLDKKGVNRTMDYLYSVLFIIMVIPLKNVIYLYTSDYYPLNIATLAEGTCMILLTVCLYAEGIAGTVKRLQRSRK